MKDIRDLQQLCYFLDANKFQKEQNLFMNYEESRETDEWLSKFPSGVIIFKASMAQLAPFSKSIKYNGYTFNIFEY